MRSAPNPILMLTLAAIALPGPASAAFHLMQIEQVLAGVDGDTSVQAVQLRMRADFENFVSASRLVAVNASGGAQVILDAIPTDVPSGHVGDRVLLATASFASHTSPPAVPDFVLDTPLPAAYLAAGSMVFETDNGLTKYWRLSWGGAAYTGPGTGSITNDADGQFNPPFGAALPSASVQALRFQGPATALSTNNAADYALTTGSVVFTNNAGTSFTVLTASASPEVVRGDAIVGEARVFPNPFTTSTRVQVNLARAGRAKLVVVDSMGRRLGEIERHLPAGAASIEWDGRAGDGSALPSGVYFYRLEVAGAARTGQVLLIR